MKQPEISTVSPFKKDEMYLPIGTRRLIYPFSQVPGTIQFSSWKKSALNLPIIVTSSKSSNKTAWKSFANFVTLKLFKYELEKP